MSVIVEKISFILCIYIVDLSIIHHGLVDILKYFPVYFCYKVETTPNDPPTQNSMIIILLLQKHST